MSLTTLLFSTHLPQKTFVRNVCRKKFPPFQMFCSFISLILHEPFFKSKNKEDTADISENIHKIQLILKL